MVSIHALLAECDTIATSFITTWGVSIHALLAECDTFIANAAKHLNGFNPRTPCGVRRKGHEQRLSVAWFQSTHSLRSATRFFFLLQFLKKFQSTHSLRSATRTRGRRVPDPEVSIHALLAECDRQGINRGGRPAGFNPRTPCGVRRGVNRMQIVSTGFQSTHSLRSATLVNRHAWIILLFQSTHSLRSATPPLHFPPADERVSIHALLAECDREPVARFMSAFRFNPRTPCGVRPRIDVIYIDSTFVSIHALLAECDRRRKQPAKADYGFNPRTPCGVRPGRGPNQETSGSFNPRTPCGVRLRPTLYIATQQSKSYFAPTSLKRPSLHGCSF